MEGNIHEAGQALRPHRRQTCDRVRIEHAIAQNSQSSRPLADQDVTVRKKGHAPRMRQTLRYHYNANLVLFARVEDKRPIAQWGHRYSRSRRLLLRESG